MAVLLDTSFLYAAAIEQDINNKRAIELSNELKTGKFGIAYYNDQVISELLTLLRMKKKIEDDDIELLGKKLITSRKNLIITNEELLKNTLIIFKTYKKLSFVDAVIIATARIYNIQKIYSFDSDLDGIKDIQRIF